MVYCAKKYAVVLYFFCTWPVACYISCNFAFKHNLRTSILAEVILKSQSANHRHVEKLNQCFKQDFGGVRKDSKLLFTAELTFLTFSWQLIGSGLLTWRNILHVPNCVLCVLAENKKKKKKDMEFHMNLKKKKKYQRQSCWQGEVH